MSLENTVVLPLTEELKTFEAWAKQKNTLYWLVPCAAAYHRWPEGREMTEATYDAAIETAGGLKMGNPS
jgi:hypothetical protein